MGKRKRGGWQLNYYEKNCIGKKKAKQVIKRNCIIVGNNDRSVDLDGNQDVLTETQGEWVQDYYSAGKLVKLCSLMKDLETEDYCLPQRCLYLSYFCVWIGFKYSV